MTRSGFVIANLFRIYGDCDRCCNSYADSDTDHHRVYDRLSQLLNLF